MACYKHRTYIISRQGVATAVDPLPIACPYCAIPWDFQPVLWNTQNLGKQAACSCGFRALDVEVAYSEKKAPGQRFSKKKGIAYDES